MRDYCGLLTGVNFGSNAGVNFGTSDGTGGGTSDGKDFLDKCILTTPFLSSIWGGIIPPSPSFGRISIHWSYSSDIKGASLIWI